MLPKKGVKIFQNCSYRDDDVANYVKFLNNYTKNGLNMFFFSKINRVTPRKKTFKIFFQLLKVKIA